LKKFFVALFFLLPALLAQSISNQPYNEFVGEQALSKVNWDWHTLMRDWKINFFPADDHYLGITYPSERCIRIFIRVNVSSSRYARVIVHEMTHYVDVTFLTNADRQRWYELREIPKKTPWFIPEEAKLIVDPKTHKMVDAYPSDYVYGSGDLAQCVVWTLQGPGRMGPNGEKPKFVNKWGPPTSEQKQFIYQQLADINTAGK
jgi:hypothetical protein